MVDFLVRFTDGKSECFLEWSTASDGPNTPPMLELEIRAYVEAEYGRKGAATIDARIARCRHRGHSMRSTGSLESELGCNRAGKDETRMTVAQMVDYYLHRGGKGRAPEGEPGDRVWTCIRHGAHPRPYCDACSAEALLPCEGDL